MDKFFIEITVISKINKKQEENSKTEDNNNDDEELKGDYLFYLRLLLSKENYINPNKKLLENILNSIQEL